MNEFNKLLNEANSNRIKKFYNLTELTELTGMSLRAVKYRMLEVKKRYNDVPFLLSKKDREWQIHYTLVEEFHPKYNLKNKTIYTQDWKSLATWNPVTNYEVKYHIELVNQIKKELPDNKVFYTVEMDGRGVNHTHIISDVDRAVLDTVVTSTIRTYIENPREVRIQVEDINNKFNLIEYLKKIHLTVV